MEFQAPASAPAFEGANPMRVARSRLGALARWIGELASDRRSALRIVYVYDTDVITTYSRPELGAPYFALLRDEATARRDFHKPAVERAALLCTTEVLLAEIVGNHVVWERGDPALNCPAHADELADVSNAVVAGAVGQVPNLRTELRRNFEALETADSGAAIDSLVDTVITRIAASAPRVFQAMRLDAAFRADRIFSVDGFRLPATTDQGLPFYFPSSIDPDSGDFVDDILKISRELEKVLSARAKAVEFDPRHLRADAHALAHLCWLNQQLEGSSSDVRVRFVTGAPQLHRLCEFPEAWVGQVPAPILGKLESLLPDLRALIRHPLAFVDESLGVPLDLWLSDRLPALLPDDQGSTDLVEATALELHALLTAARARQAVSPERHWLSGVLADVIGGRDWDETIQKRVESLLPRFLASLAVLQRPLRANGSVSRNLPPLVFESFEACDRFCTRLYVHYPHGPDAMAEAKEGLTEVIASDRSLYTPLIALALWRAADRDWARARVMSRAAVELADRYVQERADSDSGASREDDPETSMIFGEEALYLYAVATRLTAGAGHRKQDAASDLDEALAVLNRARERMSAFFRSVRGVQRVDRRFDSEEISVKLSKHLFARLGKQFEMPRTGEKELFDQAWLLFDRHVADQIDSEAVQYGHEYVLQQLCVSMVQLVLLDRYAVSGQEVFPIVATTWSEASNYSAKVIRVRDEFEAQCNRLENKARDKAACPIPVVSSFVSVVRLALRLEFAPSPTIREGIQSQKALNEFIAAKHRVATIDELRFNFLRKVIERRLPRL